MKIQIPAGAAVLHAASTLADQTVVTRAGALLSVDFGDVDLDAHLATIAALDAQITDEILGTENEALIAGLTDLKREVLGIERDVRLHFQVQAAVGNTGSQPTSTDDAATSISPTQSSVTDNEETDNEQPSQPQAEQQPARRKRG